LDKRLVKADRVSPSSGFSESKPGKLILLQQSVCGTTGSRVGSQGRGQKIVLGYSSPSHFDISRDDS
jgi:hypothetical protein